MKSGFNLLIVLNVSVAKHCVKSVRIWCISSPNSEKYGPGKLQKPTLFTQWSSESFYSHADIVIDNYS